MTALKRIQTSVTGSKNRIKAEHAYGSAEAIRLSVRFAFVCLIGHCRITRLILRGVNLTIYFICVQKLVVCANSA